MPLPLTTPATALLAGAVTALALAGCGRDDTPPGQAKAKTGKATSAAAKAAAVPAATGDLSEGAVKGGLPSVVAVSVSSGGLTRTGTGTLVAPRTVVTDARLVTTASGASAAGVSVREGNGEEHAGVVDGIDRLSGLAAIRVRDLSAVPVARWSKAPVVLGQQVVGLGFLSARRPAMRPGTVVTTGRAVREVGIAEVGLYEATANVGAQGIGGPVVDGDGAVLGITSRGLTSMVPGSVVVVPAKSALRIATALAERGRVVRAYLGVDTVAVTPTRAEELRLRTAKGVLLRGVAPGSPASFIALKRPTGFVTVGGREIPTGGDVIVAIDRTKVDEPEDLDAAIANREPGRRVALHIVRGDKAVTLRVTLGER